VNPPHRLLFICSQNRIRSLTAEHMFRGNPAYVVRSAGTSPKARIRVNEGHVRWADLIFVMEKEHQNILQENFREALEGKQLICLHIPDVYYYMEPALIDDLKAGLSQYLTVPE
jgi:predicted protein tyrosine phosphatase